MNTELEVFDKEVIINFINELNKQFSIDNKDVIEKYLSKK